MVVDVGIDFVCDKIKINKTKINKRFRRKDKTDTTRYTSLDSIDRYKWDTCIHVSDPSRMSNILADNKNPNRFEIQPSRKNTLPVIVYVQFKFNV